MSERTWIDKGADFAGLACDWMGFTSSSSASSTNTFSFEQTACLKKAFEEAFRAFALVVASRMDDLESQLASIKNPGMSSSVVATDSKEAASGDESRRRRNAARKARRRRIKSKIAIQPGDILRLRPARELVPIRVDVSSASISSPQIINLESELFGGTTHAHTTNGGNLETIDRCLAHQWKSACSLQKWWRRDRRIRRRAIADHMCVEYLLAHKRGATLKTYRFVRPEGRYDSASDEQRLIQLLNEPCSAVERVEFFESGRVAVAHIRRDGQQAKIKYDISNLSHIMPEIQKRGVGVRSYLQKKYSS